jgi:hypothetical protein
MLSKMSSRWPLRFYTQIAETHAQQGGFESQRDHKITPKSDIIRLLPMKIF